MKSRLEKKDDSAAEGFDDSSTDTKNHLDRPILVALVVQPVSVDDAVKEEYAVK